MLRTTGALDVDAAGFGHALQPGGDVDPVAEHVAVGGDDIAEVDADAQLQRPARERVLDRHGRVERLAHAAESRKEAVAGRLEEVAAVALDGRDHDFRKRRA